jgi:hypothetical protein
MISASCGDWSVTANRRHGVNTGGAIRSRTGLTGFAILSIDSQDQILTADSSPQLPQETPPQAIDLYGLGAWVAEMKKRPQHRSTRGELARGSQGDNAKFGAGQVDVPESAFGDMESMHICKTCSKNAAFYAHQASQPAMKPTASSTTLRRLDAKPS